MLQYTCIVQCINWLTDFTKIIASYNGYDLLISVGMTCAQLLHSNTSYCNGKINGCKPITVAQYTRTV